MRLMFCESYLSKSTHTETIVYAIKVPIDSISASSFKSNIVANMPMNKYYILEPLKIYNKSIYILAINPVNMLAT